MTDRNGPPGLPTVHIVEEGMREGMQIESAAIPVADKVRLLDALSATGLRTIVAGSFVSPRWVPQMAHVDELMQRFTPAPGVRYTALAFNARGQERRDAFSPPLQPEEGAAARTTIHLCDVFVQRNTARTQADEVAAVPRAVAAAAARGETTATVAVNAAWGSNWTGPFTLEQRLAALDYQVTAWQQAGITPVRAWIGDPMSWNTPRAVEETLRAISARWPSITTFHLHLHDGRGTALLSAYQALRALGPEHTLVIDSAIGGMGGCPYCGNGRATRMIPTEDLVHLLEAEGIDTGIDLDKLIEAAAVAEEVVGHQLYGRVSHAGPRPASRDRLYPMDMPFIETFEEAAHFRFGADAYDGAPSPWKQPVTSPARDAVERGEPVPMAFPVPASSPVDTPAPAGAPGRGSLRGLRVIELSTSVAGPMAAQLLGDLGAEVIKVERVGRGDDTRGWAPPYWNGLSTAFLGLNRNKKSLEIDYKDPRGKAILERLVAGADVLVQNLRPGALSAAGFGWERLRELNPRLVYCDMTGYGPDGPQAGAPAYDPLLQAYSGIVDMMPRTDSGPARVPLSILDKGTGLWAVVGILDALRRRDQTGEGSHLGVSLFGTALEWAAPGLMSTRAGDPPKGNLGSGHPGVVPYGAFPAADGYMFISAGNQGLWTRLLAALGVPELDAREGFGSNPERAARRAEVNAALGEVTGKYTRDELAERLSRGGVPHAPVRTLPEVLADPQVTALGAIGRQAHPDIPDFEVVKLPVQINGEQPPVRCAPPLLGEHTLSLLAGLGVTAAEAAALIDAGVVGTSGLKATGLPEDAEAVREKKEKQ